MWKALDTPGVQGMNTFAISTVEIASWDIVAKAFGVPAYKVLGRLSGYLPIICVRFTERRRSVAVQEGQ